MGPQHLALHSSRDTDGHLLEIRPLSVLHSGTQAGLLHQVLCETVTGRGQPAVRSTVSSGARGQGPAVGATPLNLGDPSIRGEVGGGP